MKGPWIRISAFLLMFVLMLVLPWWLSILCMIALTVYLPTYIEIFVFAFMLDVLYSAKFLFPYPALSMAFVYLIINSVVRERIRL